jgi:hypothetical protein
VGNGPPRRVESVAQSLEASFADAFGLGRADSGCSNNSEVQFGDAIADICSRLEAESLGHHRQIVTEGKIAFPKMVPNFTAFERRQQRIGYPAPSHRLPLLQLINFPT